MFEDLAWSDAGLPCTCGLFKTRKEAPVKDCSSQRKEETGQNTQTHTHTHAAGISLPSLELVSSVPDFFVYS